MIRRFENAFAQFQNENFIASRIGRSFILPSLIRRVWPYLRVDVVALDREVQDCDFAITEQIVHSRKGAINECFWLANKSKL